MDVLGYRAKIGLLLPYTNTVVQPECDDMRPLGVTNHTSRVENIYRPIHDLIAYEKTIGQGEDLVCQALDRLMPCKPNIVLLGHSLDAFYGGVKEEALSAERLSKYAGVEVVLPPAALVQALKVLTTGKRISLLTPYMPPGDTAVKMYFEDAGFEVKHVHGMRASSPTAIAEITSAQLQEAIQRIDGPDVDAIVQCGTNTATAAFATEASSRLGKPVIACNVASYWLTLRKLGIKDQMAGFGDLLQNH